MSALLVSGKHMVEFTKFNVEPDIVIYGKTLGNGYAITSVVGRREVMEYAQDTFISSNFGQRELDLLLLLSHLK